MIKVITKECREGNLAVKTTEVTLFNILIFKYRKTTTNNLAVKQLTVIEQPLKVNGFV